MASRGVEEAVVESFLLNDNITREKVDYALVGQVKDAYGREYALRFSTSLANLHHRHQHDLVRLLEHLVTDIANFCKGKSYEAVLVAITSHAETVEFTKKQDRIREILYLLASEKDVNGKLVKEEKASLHRLYEKISSANPKLKTIVTFLELCLKLKPKLIDYKNVKPEISIHEGIDTFTFSAAPVKKESNSSYYNSYSRLLFDIFEFSNQRYKSDGFDILECTKKAIELLKEDEDRKDSGLGKEAEGGKNPTPVAWAGAYFDERAIDTNLVLK